MSSLPPPLPLGRNFRLLLSPCGIQVYRQTYQAASAPETGESARPDLDHGMPCEKACPPPRATKLTEETRKLIKDHFVLVPPSKRTLTVSD